MEIRVTAKKKCLGKLRDESTKRFELKFKLMYVCFLIQGERLPMGPLSIPENESSDSENVQKPEASSYSSSFSRWVHTVMEL